MSFQASRTFVIIFLICSFFLAQPLVSAAIQFPPPPETPQVEIQKADFVEDELLVKFREGVDNDKKDKVHEKYGSEKIKLFDEIRVDLIKLKKETKVEDAIKQYEGESEVEYAEPNYYIHLFYVPNDPSLSDLWGLNNAGQSYGGKTGTLSIVRLE